MTQLDSLIKEKKTIDIVRANILGIFFMIPVMIFYGLPYYLICGNDFIVGLMKREEGLSGWILVLFFLSFVLGIIVHELIHGLVWSRFNNGFKFFITIAKNIYIYVSIFFKSLAA
ncbi:MAG: hypothetical protein ACM3RX_00955 [Methanococcaceae archaeon]